MKIEHIHIGAIVHKVRLAIVLAFGLISTAHATLIPILEYPMGEGDSPNVLGGPAANPSSAPLTPLSPSRRSIAAPANALIHPIIVPS